MTVQTAWDSIAEEYCRRHGEDGSLLHTEYAMPAILEMVGNAKGKKALDIGCGPGYLTRPLARSGAKATGIDISIELLKRAREHESREPLGIKYLQLDASRLDGIASSSMDIIASNLAFQAIQDAGSALRECGRVLKPGGKFVFSILHPVTDTLLPSDYRSDFAGPYVRLRRYGLAHEKAHRGFKLTRVPTYHRPFGFYLNGLFDAGFAVSGCREISISHLSRVVGLPGVLRPAIMAGSAFAPALFSRFVRLEKTDDRKALEKLAEFPLFLVLEAVKKG